MSYKYAPFAFDFHVDLITPEHLVELPDGTVLYNIFGKPHTKGVDEIDDDTRGGFIAFGFLCKDKHTGEDNMGMYESDVKKTQNAVFNPFAEGYVP